MIFRRQIGWCVAQACRLSGARGRAVKRWLAEGQILPVVFHALPAEGVRSVLRTLVDLGGKDIFRTGKVWLSFDDGWQELREVVTVLETFEAQATVFIAPGETMRGNVWTDAAQQLGIAPEEWRSWYGLSEDERMARLAICGENVERVRQMGCGCCGGGCRRHVDWDGAVNGVRRRLLTVAEVHELARHPLIRIGNHTWSHLSAPHRPMEEVLDEVDRAQAELTSWTGSAPTDFAYPFGRGTPELDAAIRARGLTPHYTRQGFVTRETLGAARNMAIEGVSDAENIGRVLMAWPKVGETL